MKPQLKIEQRLKELSDDRETYLKEREEIYKKFKQDKQSGSVFEVESIHQIDLQITAVKAKISIIKEILEIK